MTDKLDLTLFSTTFPDRPEPEIQRDNLISWLHDRFSPERRAIIVQGPVGAGKTTLLAQFARTYPDRCFSFFAGMDYWTSRPDYFLLELCTQMHKALGSRGGAVDDQLDYDQLKKTFGTFYRRVAESARKARTPFYFVIDGLEWAVPRHEQESIIDLLPTDLPRGIFLLAGSAPGQGFQFNHEAWAVPFLSPLDSSWYLEGLGLSKEDVDRVHTTCQGMPGYVAQIRRLIEAGADTNNLIRGLPEEIRGLFEIEWGRGKIESSSILQALAVLAFAEEPLDLSTLAQMLEMEVEEVKSSLASVSFVQFDPNGALHFVSDAHKTFAAEKLRSRREQTLETLIQYYQTDPYGDSSLVLLPAYYVKTNNYESLRSLVSIDHLVLTLKAKRDLALLRRNVHSVARMAYDTKDWQNLSKYSFASSILRAISRKPVMETEIEALLALDDYGQAFEIAYQAVLPEDRLHLLSKVGGHMKQKGLSVPDEVISELEHMIAEVDPTNLRERPVEIAAGLFHLIPQAAIELVEKSVKAGPGERLMDFALTVLALKLELETDSTEVVRSRISDQSLQDFSRANSPVVGGLTAEQVLAEAEKIQDTSGKLFLLRGWCNRNRRNEAATKVVSKALEIITETTGYQPSMLVLRQFAEPLMASTATEVHKLAERLDLLKTTAIDKPAEEALRLELLLAAIESRKSFDVATNRLYEIYYNSDDIPELDTRCYCLPRMLLSLPDIDPEDSLNMQKEIEQRLVEEYRALLDGSAEHLAVTRRLLRALTVYKPEMAVKFASMLNMVERRDKAYQEVLRVYVDRDPEDIDLSFVEDVLAKISEVERRDSTLVRLIERFAQMELFAHVPQTRRFIDRIREIPDPRSQCYAYAYSLRAMASAGESGLAEDLFAKMTEAWSKIDPKWEQVRLGFDLVAIVAKPATDLAQKLLERTREERATSPLAEEFFARVYIDTLRLAARAMSGLIGRDPDFSVSRDQLIEMIRRVPSCAVQSELLANLALRHHLSDRHQDFEQLVREAVLPSLDSCSDAEARARTVVRIAPCIYEYEPGLMKERVSSLSPSRQDNALGNVVVYLLSKRLPDDPIDLDSLRVEMNYKTATRVCDVIKLMNYDSAMYSFIDRLVEALVRQDPRDRRREISLLDEKQAFRIAENLEGIIARKLPDSSNIQHKGYQIAAQASVARLQASAARRKEPTVSWQEIDQESKSVPNIADRALVMAWAGEKMYRSELNLGTRLLKEAEELIPAIPNIIDRGHRLCALAEAWKQLDDKESAKVFLHEAMSILQTWSWDRTRDQVTGQILQLAHSLDPEFAASLTSLVDNPIVRHGIEDDLTARDLQRQPHKVADSKQEARELQHLLGQAAWRMLKSICSGRGHIQHEKLVGQWLHTMVDAEFDSSYQVMAWSIQNVVEGTKQVSVLKELYRGLLACLELGWLIGQTLLSSEGRAWDLQRGSPTVPDNLRLFRAGTRPEALITVHEWMRENARTYVKIYDPYFSVTDLDVLKSIDPDIRVYIVTSWKEQRGVTPGDPEIEQLYREAWRGVSDQDPPWTCVIIVGIKTGDSPIHSRYIITENSGLALGTSVSGLGVKDTDIRILDSNEALALEAQFVDPLLGPQLRPFRGEPLIVRIFTL